ncbi:hypothetical protein CRG98_015351 [Punica granatum]|uniref:Uncharacterized protein n=1 Tax=Punica granatum TaxID=22663 RepID=A0A2I0K6Q8_PUNGR|nr:hypothetical protein CRG98_015351 [Punica granatum]
MDIGKTIFDVVLQCWDCISKYLAYIQSLEDNVGALRRKKDDLSHVFEDVNRRVMLAEGEHKVRTSEVAGWLKNAQLLMQEVDSVLQRGEQEMHNSCLCSLCPKNCRSRYKQSKLAEAMKSTVEAQVTQGRNFKDDIAYEPADLILERSLNVLRSKMDELVSVFEDVNRQVKEAEDRHIKRTSEVGSWLDRVGVLKEEVGKLLDKGEQEIRNSRLSSGDRSPKNTQTCYELSKLSDEKKSAVQEELLKGHLYSVGGMALELAGTAFDFATTILVPTKKGFNMSAFGQHKNEQSQLELPAGSPTDVLEKEDLEAKKAP